MMNDMEFLTALTRVGFSGELQAIDLSANVGELSDEKINEYVMKAAAIARSETDKIYRNFSASPFAHGAVTLFFKNGILSRLSLSAAPLPEKAVWRLFSTGAEIIFTENGDVAEMKKAELDAPTEKIYKKDFK